MDPIAVLFNPSSGRGKSLKRKTMIRERLQHYDIPFRWFTSKSEDHLKDLARNLLRDYAVITAVGGDTTFTLIATEILNSGVDTSLGIVGAGSANDISRGLGVYELDSLCSALRSQHTRRMDAGCLQLPDHPAPIYFMGALSLGLGVEVNLYIAKARERHPVLNWGGSAVQALTGVFAVRKAFSSQSVPDRINLDTGNTNRDVEFSLIVFANTPYYANGIRLLPEATPFDGRIHCCSVQTRSLTETVNISRTVANGSHVLRDEVEIIPDTVFHVTPEKGTIAIQYDGEIMQEIVSFSVSVLPAALKVVTPLLA
jgi:diacylglycerol kinase (ATP)